MLSVTTIIAKHVTIQLLSVDCMQVLFILACTRVALVLQSVLLFNVSFGVALIRGRLFEVRVPSSLLLCVCVHACARACPRRRARACVCVRARVRMCVRV